VGGVAAVLEGAPITTLDLDVVYPVDEETLRRLAIILRRLDTVYRDPAGRKIEPTIERLRQNRINLLETRLGLLDAMQQIGPGWRYAEVLERSHPVDLGDLRVRVLDLEAVIESKEAAGREKDLAMLPVLRRTLQMIREREA
jgi:hypothetical protein